MMTLQAQIQYLSKRLKVTEEQFNMLIYNTGEQYVLRNYHNETVRSRLLHSSRFWKWWKSVWSNYLRSFIIHTQGVPGLGMTELEMMFNEFVSSQLFISQKMFSQIVKPSKIKEL